MSIFLGSGYPVTLRASLFWLQKIKKKASDISRAGIRGFKFKINQHRSALIYGCPLRELLPQLLNKPYAHHVPAVWRRIYLLWRLLLQHHPPVVY